MVAPSSAVILVHGLNGRRREQGKALGRWALKGLPNVKAASSYVERNRRELRRGAARGPGDRVENLVGVLVPLCSRRSLAVGYRNRGYEVRTSAYNADPYFYN